MYNCNFIVPGIDTVRYTEIYSIKLSICKKQYAVKTKLLKIIQANFLLKSSVASYKYSMNAVYGNSSHMLLLTTVKIKCENNITGMC